MKVSSVTAPVPLHPCQDPPIPPQWALGGEEPALHFSISSDVSLIMETEILPYVCSH
jgi:hypothetical protein